MVVSASLKIRPFYTVTIQQHILIESFTKKQQKRNAKKNLLVIIFNYNGNLINVHVLRKQSYVSFWFKWIFYNKEFLDISKKKKKKKPCALPLSISM